MTTTTLYRPVGPKELELIVQNGFQKFPRRLTDFYPVLDESYAEQVARCWNAPASGAGFVTRFEVKDEFLSRYGVQTVGQHREYWIPGEDLDELNRNIVGKIEVIASYP
jgi:hypothetical protein